MKNNFICFFSSVLLGGWPSNWDDGDVLLRKSDEKNNK